MKAKRVYATVAVGALLVGLFVFVPLPISRVKDTGLVAVSPESADPVGLVVPGQLVSLHVQEGQAVKRGQILAKFDSRELREQRLQAVSKRDESYAVADSLTQLIGTLPRDAQEKAEADAKSARQKGHSYAEQVRVLDEQLTRVSDLTAPRDGVVMGLPKPTDVGKAFDRNLSQGQPVCTVGDPTRLRVKVPVSPLDYKLLREDLPAGGELPVSVYVKGRTDHVFQGVVRRLPESDAKQVPFPLTQRGGGPLAVKQSGEGGQEVSPVAQTYLVDVELTDPDATVKPGALVSVKIHCHWRSGAWWVKRKLAEALDIGLY